MWDRFDARVSDPTAAAWRWVEETLNRSLAEAVDHFQSTSPTVDDQTLKHWLGFLKMTLLSLQELPESHTSIPFYQTLIETAEQVLADRGVPLFVESIPSPEKFEAYSRLYDRQRGIEQSRQRHPISETILAVEGLLAQIEKVEMMPPSVYLGEDLAALKGATLENLADAYEAQGELPAAVDRFERAIQIADRLTLVELSSRCRQKLATLQLARVGATDDGLGPLLEQALAMVDTRPSVGRVQTGLLLAKAYADFGDRFEAGHWLDRVERDLEGLGYTAPTATTVPAVVEQWIEAVDHATRQIIPFLESIYWLHTTFMGIAEVRQRISTTLSEQEEAAEIGNALRRSTNALIDRQALVAQRDQETYARIPGNGWGAPLIISNRNEPSELWAPFFLTSVGLGDDRDAH